MNMEVGEQVVRQRHGTRLPLLGQFKSTVAGEKSRASAYREQDVSTETYERSRPGSMRRRGTVIGSRQSPSYNKTSSPIAGFRTYLQRGGVVFRLGFKDFRQGNPLSVK